MKTETTKYLRHLANALNCLTQAQNCLADALHYTSTTGDIDTCFDAAKDAGEIILTLQAKRKDVLERAERGAW